jgi:hypothetical protein
VDVVDRKFWVDHNDVERTRDQSDRRERGKRVVRQFGVKAWVDRMRERRHQQRISVGRARRDRGATDDRTGAWLVLNNDRLT